MTRTRMVSAALVALVLAGPVAAQEAATEEGLKVYFDSGTARVRGDQVEVLDQAARLFREGSPIVMVLSGSADTVGAAERNLDLSIRRAAAVANGLVDRGIPAERLQVLGRGNSELVVATEDGVDNAENRSVTITWR